VTEASLRADIVEIGRRLYARGYVASNDGNISVRLDGARLLMTPAGVSKGFMTPDMMVVTDFDGRVVPAGTEAGGRRPSTESQMHLAAYRERPDVQAVVHAHPPLATGFAVAGIALDRAVLAEVVTTLGSIPIAAYGTPSTPELPTAVAQYVKAHDGMLLANHGALALGRDLFSAYYRMETIEHAAHISLVARLLGREHLLSRAEVRRLQDLRGNYGIAAPAPICADDQIGGGESCQVVIAPDSAARLVPVPAGVPPAARWSEAGEGAERGMGAPRLSKDGEIRLTYRQLTALIEDAVKAITDS
jgi:L-fuculose-phosphate aldolase